MKYKIVINNKILGYANLGYDLTDEGDKAIANNINRFENIYGKISRILKTGML